MPPTPPVAPARSILDQFDADPTSPYWSLRLVESTHDDTAEGREPRLVRAYAQLASYDPSLFVHPPVFLHMRFASARQLSFEAFGQVDAGIALSDPSMEALVKGLLWTLAGAFRKTDVEKFRQRAVGHFEAVSEENRGSAFWAAYGEALDGLEYPRFRAIIDSYLAHADAHGVVKVLVRAAGASDWSTYDRIRPRYVPEAEPFGDPHDECAVLNADGLRSLADNDMKATEEIMAKLLDRGRNVNFLNNLDTMTFVHALVPKKLLLQESLDYVTMAARDGWKSPEQEEFAKSLREALGRS